MNLNLRTFRWAELQGRVRGMFNLNDPRWGRGDDQPTEGKADGKSTPPDGANRPQNPPNGRDSGPAGNGTPPDLDEIWRDFNRKLGGFFNTKPSGRGPDNGGGPSGNGGGFQPDLRHAGLGLGAVAAAVLVIWLGSGFFIVQEGQQAVITQFGRYKSTVGAGFNWRLPYPIQRHELVFVTQIRSLDVGRDTVIKATGLRESAMLTEDENIVEIKFAVQYRLSDARAFLFESRSPTEAVVQAAETAVREVVGKMRMDSALAEERDQIASRVRALMQTILDRYNVGVEVVGINLQQGGVRPPEQVQSAFDDVLKAGQERERAKNEAQAYANDVIPRAVGAASRLKEESEAYKARVIAQAQGDAERFRLIQAEYQKAPQVTRDRMYNDAMQQILTSTTKMMVDMRQGSMVYLPLDKIIQQVSTPEAPAPAAAPAAALPSSAPTAPSPSPDPRTRDAARTRDRETR